MGLEIDRRLESLKLHPAGDGWILDLSGAKWLHPLHLVAAAAIAHRVRVEGSWVRLEGLGPKNAGYAARMDLGVAIEEHGGTHALPEVNRRDRTGELLEVSRVESSVGISNWARLVFERVSGVNAEAAHALHSGLAEIGENVCLHSGTYGFVAAQMSPTTGTIRFAVADAGYGLKRTLEKRGATSDYRALDLALCGTSRLDGAHGFGLTSTRDLVTGLGGSFVLASGNAAATGTAAGHRLHRAEFAGTLFEGTVPARGGGVRIEMSPPGTRRRGEDLPHRRRAFTQAGKNS